MADKTFRLEIIAPDRIFYSNDIYMVEYNTVEGQVGVYADHIPMTQIIAPGRLIITERNEEKQAALWESIRRGLKKLARLLDTAK